MSAGAARIRPQQGEQRWRLQKVPRECAGHEQPTEDQVDG